MVLWLFGPHILTHNATHVHFDFIPIKKTKIHPSFKLSPSSRGVGRLIDEKIRAGSKRGKKVTMAKQFLGIHRNCDVAPLPAVQQKKRGQKNKILKHRVPKNECIACAEKAVGMHKKKAKKGSSKRKMTLTDRETIKRTKSAKGQSV